MGASISGVALTPTRGSAHLEGLSLGALGLASEEGLVAEQTCSHAAQGL